MNKIIDKFNGDHPEVVDLKVTGSLPNWLKGSLYRNGPGKYNFGEDEGVHVFDGMAVIHQYIIKDGAVKYHNRLLDSDTYRRNKAANRIVMTEFGVIGRPDPCKSLFTRHFTYFAESVQMTDNDSVNIMQMGDQLYTMTETPLMNQIHPVTLERTHQVDWRRYVSVHMATAHPLQEPDGTTYNMGTCFGPHSSYKIIKIPPPQPGDINPARAATIIGSIPAQWPLMPNYAHSFGMTDNYIIFIEQPLAFNFLNVGTARVTGKSFMDALHYYDGYKTKFHVLHKYTGAKISLDYVAKPFFVFHHINAFEDNCQIVVDLATYEDASIIHDLTLKNLRNDYKVPTALYKRFVLPLCVNKQNENLVKLDYTTAQAIAVVDGTIYCVPEYITDAYIELPRINYDYNGKKYKYVYGIHSDASDQYKLMKIDIPNSTLTFWYEEDYYPGEPIFVTDPHGIEEDDGVILAPFISINDDQQSFLLVMDAKSFTELARAIIPSDVNVPNTFHGIFTDIDPTGN